MLKVFERSGIQGTYLNRIKAIYSKPIDRLNGEKLKVISLKSGIRQGYLLSLYLFNIVLRFPARERRLKGYKLERKKSRNHYLQMI